MKKIIAIILLLCMLLLSGCAIRRQGISHYQYMYNGMVDVWNSHATPGCEVNTLLGYGSYLYNSYLILFPRETPSTLTDYFFYWFPGMDRDEYAIYFTCKLSENNFNKFLSGLTNFEITDGEKSAKPIYDEEHFSLPTYILQWVDVGEKWEVLEYVMIDAKYNTVVFVYTMSAIDRIATYSQYEITPPEYDFLEHSFSIYVWVDDSPFHVYDDNFDECIYDISFIDNLM